MMDRASHRQRTTTVPFLSGWTRAPKGPAALALRNGAAIVLGVTWRDEDGSTAVAFRRVDTVDGASVADLTRTIVGAVESEVRCRPDQWFWIHRRLRFPASPDGAGQDAA
jgi:lauroyl/myristoyl acyltransferase